MSKRQVGIYSAVTWVSTFIFSGLLIMGASLVLENASTATAETAVCARIGKGATFS